MNGRSGLSFRVLAAALAVGVLATGPGPDRDQRLIARMSAAASEFGHRATRALLGEPFPYAPFASFRGAADRGVSATRFRSEILSIAGEVGDRTPRAAGIASVLVGDFDTAIARLAPLCRSGAAAACTDLAAAHLAKADATKTVLPIVDALAASDQALAIAPRLGVALFNRALALEGLELEEEARVTFLAAASALEMPPASEALRRAKDLRADEGPGWNDARGHLEQAAARDDAARVRDIVDRFPEEARRWAESVWPLAWAEAVTRNDAGAAGLHLQCIRSVAAALQERNGDALLVDVARTLDRARTDAERSMLARAYFLYRDGRMAHRRDDAVQAMVLLAGAAERFQHAGSPMALVARYYGASASFAGNRLTEAAAELRKIRRQLPANRRYRSLEALTGWEGGLCLLQQGSISEGVDVLTDSRDTFAALGETQSGASIEGFLASAYEYIGDAERAWSHRKRAFAVQKEARRRGASLGAAIEGAIQRREWSRAHALLNVTIELAERTDDAVGVVTALLQRSIVAARSGDVTGARRDLALLGRWRPVPSVAAILPRIDAGAALVEGLLQREANPAASIAAFTRALQYYEQSNLLAYAPAAYLERARSQMRAGAPGGALRSIDAGLQIAEQQRRSVRGFQERAQTLMTMRELFDEGISIATASADQERAFQLAELARARAVLELFAGQTTEPLSLAEIQRALSPDAAIVEFTSVADDVFVFVIRRSSFAVRKLSLPRGGLRQIVDDLAEVSRVEDAALGVLGRGHYLLIAPIVDLLGDARQLAIVPDGEMLGIPFASLYDPESRQLLIERFGVMQSPSATLAVECSRRARRAFPSQTVAVGATSFDQKRFSELEMLPDADDEARSVAMLYGRAEVLIGEQATREAVLHSITRATIFHFAGHGVNFSDRPLQSALLTAPDGERSAYVTASDIVELRLDRLSVVFLSTCRSATGNAQRDGVQNVATAFLGAGAPTIIGATADIEDSDSREFAIAFHRELVRSGDAATALHAVARRGLYRRNSSAVKTFILGGSRDFVMP